MEIEVIQHNKEAELKLKGRLDNTSAPQVQNRLNEILPGCSSLKFDFAEVDYVSSAGLRVLLMARKRIGSSGEVSLLHVNEVVREILEMSGFLDILNVK